MSRQVCLIFIYPLKIGCIFHRTHIIFPSKYFDLGQVLSYKTERKGTKTRHDRVVVLSISSREHPAAASTSFSDEKYAIINLFSEYHIIGPKITFFLKNTNWHVTKELSNRFSSFVVKGPVKFTQQVKIAH